MTSKKIFISFFLVLLVGCSKSSSNTGGSIKNQNGDICYVDSTVFNKKYIKKTTGKSYQILPDGTTVEYIMNGDILETILINGKNKFKRCSPKMEQITDKDLINGIFREVEGLRSEDLSRFYNAWFAICNTVDESWHFMKKEGIGYVGYAGPGDLPVSVVGMKCN